MSDRHLCRLPSDPYTAFVFSLRGDDALTAERFLLARRSKPAKPPPKMGRPLAPAWGKADGRATTRERLARFPWSEGHAGPRQPYMSGQPRLPLNAARQGRNGATPTNPQTGKGERAIEHEQLIAKFIARGGKG